MKNTDESTEYEPFGTIDISEDLASERRLYIFGAVMLACVVASFTFSVVWAAIH